MYRIGERATGDPTRELKTERLNEMAFAFKQAGTLLAAIELGLFTAIAEGKGTLEEIAAAIRLDPEAADRLLIACKALDLVCDEHGRYRNRSDVERYLVKSSRTYFGDYLVYQARSEYDRLQGPRPRPQAGRRARAAAALRGADGGPRRGATLHGGRLQRLALARAPAGEDVRLLAVHSLARLRRRLGLLLDRGLRAQSGAATIVMDFPNVLAVTRELVAKHGLQDRIETHAGNFLVDPLPSGCDLVSFITPLQSYMPDQVIRALTRAREAVEPGGAVLVLDYMLDDDKAGPLDPAFMNLQGIRQGHCTGRVNSGAEWRSFMEAAGLGEIEVRWFTRHQLGLVTGRKPRSA